MKKMTLIALASVTLFGACLTDPQKHETISSSSNTGSGLSSSSQNINSSSSSLDPFVARKKHIDSLPLLENSILYFGKVKEVRCDEIWGSSTEKRTTLFDQRGGLIGYTILDSNGNLSQSRTIQWNGNKPISRINTNKQRISYYDDQLKNWVYRDSLITDTVIYNWIASDVVKTGNTTWYLKGSWYNMVESRDNKNRLTFVDKTDSMGIWLGGDSFDSTGAKSGWGSERKSYYNSMAQIDSVIGVQGIYDTITGKRPYSIKIYYSNRDSYGNFTHMEGYTGYLDSNGIAQKNKFSQNCTYTYW